MKTLLHSLPLALLAALAVLPFAAGTRAEAQPQQADERLVCEASDSLNACGRCGDLYCAKQCGETAKSCPQDCGTAG